MTALTPAAIEAAARAGYVEQSSQGSPELQARWPWERTLPSVQEYWRDLARAMLSAAGLLLTADVDQAVAADRERIAAYLRTLAESITNGTRVGDLQPCCETCPADVLTHAAAAIARTPATPGGKP